MNTVQLLTHVSATLEAKGYKGLYLTIETRLNRSTEIDHVFYCNQAERQHLYSTGNETLELFYTRVEEYVAAMPSQHDAEVKRAVNNLEEAREILNDCGEEDFANGVGLSIQSIHTNLLTAE
jgi:hypothetical protein